MFSEPSARHGDGIVGSMRLGSGVCQPHDACVSASGFPQRTQRIIRNRTSTRRNPLNLTILKPAHLEIQSRCWSRSWRSETADQLDLPGSPEQNGRLQVRNCNWYCGGEIPYRGGEITVPDRQLAKCRAGGVRAAVEVKGRVWLGVSKARIVPRHHCASINRSIIGCCRPYRRCGDSKFPSAHVFFWFGYG